MRTLMRTLGIALVLVLCGCGSLKSPVASTPEPMRPETEVLQRINTALKAKDKQAFLDELSQGYRREQLKFLNYDTAQFLSELHCGTNQNEKFLCPAWEEVKEWQLIESKPVDWGLQLVLEVVLKSREKVKVDAIFLRKENGRYFVLGSVG